MGNQSIAYAEALVVSCGCDAAISFQGLKPQISMEAFRHD
jgi:hypothetical protein